MREDNAILEKAEICGFVDPLTGYPPKGETALSALLSIYHQQQRVDWSKIKMRLLEKPNNLIEESVDLVIQYNGYLTNEYPLFWKEVEQERHYGGMRPDFLYLSADGKTVALIENKIGASDTHKGDSYGGQFGRYIKYLLDADLSERYVIVITSRIYVEKNPPWYATDLRKAADIQDPEGKVKYRIILWEEILEAFA